MSVSDADIAFAHELFAPLGSAVSHRKMFGGICLYLAGDIFALVDSEGQIYLKSGKPPHDALGDSTQFHNMPYWSLPDALLDDPDAASDLARATMATL